MLGNNTIGIPIVSGIRGTVGLSLIGRGAESDETELML